MYRLRASQSSSSLAVDSRMGVGNVRGVKASTAALHDRGGGMYTASSSSSSSAAAAWAKSLLLSVPLHICVLDAALPLLSSLPRAASAGPGGRGGPAVAGVDAAAVVDGAACVAVDGDAPAEDDGGNAVGGADWNLASASYTSFSAATRSSRFRSSMCRR